MQFRALIAAAVVASFSFAAAENHVLRVDYPKVCGSYCGPPVTASHACGEKGVQCVCDTKHMKKLIPLCEACTKVQSGPQNQDYHQSKHDEYQRLLQWVHGELTVPQMYYKS